MKRVEPQSRPSTEVSLLHFRVGRGLFALEVSSVREILAPLEIVTVPHSARIVLGVAEHRDQVIPIVDLRRRFGLPPNTEGRRSKWIVIEVGRHLLGIVVDEVSEVIRTDASHERPAPQVGPNRESTGISKVFAHQGALVMVLNLETLYRAVESDTLGTPLAAIELSLAGQRS
ncbi:MAG: chemotaxis protein CheW [Deltaproteobacteria bacterium]|nr:chemotaxis protein CheW [Deltaproteobacteria bacterium]